MSTFPRNLCYYPAIMFAAHPTPRAPMPAFHPEITALADLGTLARAEGDGVDAFLSHAARAARRGIVTAEQARALGALLGLGNPPA